MEIWKHISGRFTTPSLPFEWKDIDYGPQSLWWIYNSNEEPQSPRGQSVACKHSPEPHDRYQPSIGRTLRQEADTQWFAQWSAIWKGARKSEKADGNERLQTNKTKHALFAAKVRNVREHLFELLTDALGLPEIQQFCRMARSLQQRASECLQRLVEICAKSCILCHSLRC